MRCTCLSAPVVFLFCLLAAPWSNGLVIVTGSTSPSAGSDAWRGASPVLASGVDIGYQGYGKLTVSGGSGLSNTFANIGYIDGVTGEVSITGTNSSWTNSSILRVGYFGNGVLTVSGGGRVSNTYAYIGYDKDGSGQVTVTGANSSWESSNDLHVGYYGTGTLAIADSGSVVVNGRTYVEYNNSASGSIAFNAGTLTTGGLFADAANLSGSGTVTTRGLVGDGYDLLVFDASDTAVTQLTNGSETLTFTVAADGTASMGADMRVINGAQIHSTQGFLGYFSADVTNAEVTGTGSSWTNSSDLSIGYSGNGVLTVSGGGNVSNQKGYIGYNSGGVGEVMVTGEDSDWTNSSNLYIGYSGDGTLMITDSAEVSSSSSYIGYGSGSYGEVSVSGTGSSWSHEYSGRLYIGYYGDGVLRISGGATVANGSAEIGYYGDSVSEVTVTGAGSSWTNRSNLTVANNGDATLMISDGASVSDITGTIGDRAGSTGRVTVTGVESKWTNTGGLYVGYSGDGSLTIADSAAVNVDGTTFVQYQSTATGRIVFNGGTLTTGGLVADAENLSGTGTIMTSGLIGDHYGDMIFNGSNTAVIPLVDGDDTLVITITADGTASMGADMHVINGAQIASTNGFLGHFSGDVTNAEVIGTGSSWANSSDLSVGYSGNGLLKISDGGSVSNRQGFIGDNAGSSGEVLVTGEGASWTNSSSLSVGESGLGMLMVSEGGSASSSTSYIGNKSGGVGQVTITGSDSSWSAGAIYVSYVGSGELTVSDGASVSSSYGYIGYYNYNPGVVTVTGVDSTWTNSGQLHIGEKGEGILTISDGGSVSNSYGYIGYSSGSVGKVTVTGLGSSWTNTSSLFVGSSGSGVVTVSDGAQIVAISSMGVNASSTVNLALSSRNDSLLKIGDDSHTSAGLMNNGTVNLFSVGSMSAGTYTPISAGTSGSIGGSGTYRGFGGSWNGTSGEFIVNALTGVSFGTYSSSMAGLRLMYGDGSFISAFADDSTGADFTVEVVTDTGLEEAIVAYTITSATVSIEDVLLCFDVEDYIGADGYLLMYRASAADEWGEYDYTVVSSFYTEQDGYLSLVASVDADTGIGGYGDYALIAVPELEQFAAILGLLVLLAACRRGMREKC
ncbi:MAG: hypothetical protein Q7Q73_11130 [Verrucomicrobiota bacterium JB024]|nr:hypothetical protein [Verrucomicrobiota bacterium JB024]